MKKSKRAFTLIEVLVVVGLIAVLAAITFVAINPAKNFADARNTQRSSDALQILNAITQYTSEDGNTLAGLGTIASCPAVTDIGSGTGNLDLASNLVPEYIVGIPVDPTSGTAADTGYTICAEGNGRVTVAAPSAENSAVIAVKR